MLNRVEAVQHNCYNQIHQDEANHAIESDEIYVTRDLFVASTWLIPHEVFCILWFVRANFSVGHYVIHQGLRIPRWGMVPLTHIPRWGMTPLTHTPKWGMAPFTPIPRWGMLALHGARRRPTTTTGPRWGPMPQRRMGTATGLRWRPVPHRRRGRHGSLHKL